MNFRGYHGLTVWNRAVDLVEMIYRITDALRTTAAPEVLAEMRRCVLAIPSHLAAGYQTPDSQEYLRHVHASQITLGKLETYMTILGRLEWTEDEDLDDVQSLLTHLSHLLSCLERYLTGERPEIEEAS